jgi:hypothetical protein
MSEAEGFEKRVGLKASVFEKLFGQLEVVMIKKALG